MSHPTRWNAEDWRRYGEHAAIEAIEALMDTLGNEVFKAERALERLADLRAKRRRQIATGEWPLRPKNGILSVRLSTDELAALDRRAEAAGQNRSEALREIVAEIIREHEPATQDGNDHA